MARAPRAQSSSSGPQGAGLDASTLYRWARAYRASGLLSSCFPYRQPSVFPGLPNVDRDFSESSGFNEYIERDMMFDVTSSGRMYRMAALPR
jgi:hypothetical protein